MAFFAYHIVPMGGHRGQAVESGTCTAPDIEAAKRHVQTVSAPRVVKTGLEVILQDSAGVEIWRGLYARLMPKRPRGREAPRLT
jgi:hypothetical protein